MAFDADHLRKPFTKLSKAIRGRQLDEPERVHRLRTNARRVEAILGAVDLARLGRKKQLLKALKKIRRAAGKVRDMDALTGKAADVSVSGERSCRIRLLQHLGGKRQRKAHGLAWELKNRGGSVRNELKGCAKRIDPLLAKIGASREKREEEALVSGHAQDLSSRLQKFATLGRSNLHEYRKQGKVFRYVLQIVKPQDEGLLDGLREMQAAIGEWHDWEELIAIAKDVLDHGPKCKYIRELRLHADGSFDKALRVANAMRKRLLSPGRPRRPQTTRLRIVKTAV